MSKLLSQTQKRPCAFESSRIGRPLIILEINVGSSTETSYGTVTTGVFLTSKRTPPPCKDVLYFRTENLGNL